MDDDKTCPVCFDTYKFPKMLPCKHTFCMVCLEEYLEGFEDKSNLVCPLCREPCFVPQKGFDEFLTNYFVPAERYPNKCQVCHVQMVVKVCHQCATVLCRKCVSLHYHAQEERNEVDSESETSTGLPIHLQFQLAQTRIKTEIRCKTVNIILGKFDSVNDQDTRKSVSMMFRSQSGGLFVKFSDSDLLLKYNMRGKIVDQIQLAWDMISGLETSEGRLLITHVNSEKLITCYRSRFRETFSKTPNFLPVGLTELRDGNIAVCGPTHLCDTSCGRNVCEISKAGYGLMSIFTPRGRLVREIVEDQMEYIFKFPIQMAASTKTDTIAICDRNLERVIILDYNGKVRGFFKGLDNTPMPFLQFLGHGDEHFHPTSVCSTSDGNFLVADPSKEYLFVINPYGKLVGILRSNSDTDLSGITSVCVDAKQNVWAGHFNMGTISILNPSSYQNQLRLRRLPSSSRSGLLGPNSAMRIQIGGGSISDLSSLCMSSHELI